MYGHNYQFPYGYTMDNVDHFALSNATVPSISPSTTLLSPVSGNEHDSISALKAELCYSSSGCSSYGSPSSHTSYGTYNQSFLQRSIEGFSPLVSSPTAYTELETSSVRKVFSTDDLQEMNLVQRNYRSESPLSSESTSIIESMNKACRYSPEEMKEKIERYRSKRNLRNFTKKIKYECRKTLADSRPRIRGRFARNDESEKTPQNEWGHTGVEEDENEDIENWLNFLDAYSANLIQ